LKDFQVIANLKSGISEAGFSLRQKSTLIRPFYIYTSTIATPSEIEDPELHVPDNFEQREGVRVGKWKNSLQLKKKELNIEIYHPDHRRKTGQLSIFPVQLKGSV
jgi:hypothetical protein